MIITNFLKKNYLLLFIIAVGAFLRFDRLSTLMVFIGDQGWFYISARDLLVTGSIPLVGITSSHTWLHQGPLWTYMLAGALWVSNFNPVSGAVLAALIGLGSIFLIYKIGAEFVSKTFGLIAALVYATAPLIIIHERLAYHTAPISFMVLLLIYSLLNVTRGRLRHLPLVGFCISILYNFELATIVLIPPAILILGKALYVEDDLGKLLKKQKIVALSVFGLIVPMIPILIYDFGHGFPQTIKFGGWFFYKALQLFGFFGQTISEPFSEVMHFFINKISLLIFAHNLYVSIIILIAIFLLPVINILRKKKFSYSLFVVFLLTGIAVLGFFAARTGSEAYLPMLFPGLVLLMTQLIYGLYKKNIFTFFILITLVVLNILYITQNNYLVGKTPGYGPSLKKRIEVAEYILNQAKAEKYNIKGKGPGSEFDSFTANYEFILWKMGNPPSKSKQTLVFTIEEKQGKIDVKIE